MNGRIRLNHRVLDLALARPNIDPRQRVRLAISQRATDEIDNEQLVLLIPRQPAARRHHFSQRHRSRLRPTPMQPIVQQILALRLQWIVRPPERDHVVVDFPIARYLHQLHNTVAPIADRLDPGRGPTLVVRLQILIIGKLPLTLHQPKATHAVVSKRADLQRVRVGKRSPYMLAPDWSAAAAHSNHAPPRDSHWRACDRWHRT